MFLALRDLAFAKGRFALMATVILLVAFLMVLLSGLSSGLIERNVSGIKLMKATHIAFEFDDTPSYVNSFVDKEMWEAWAKVPGVSAMTPLGNATFNARNSDGTPLTVTLWGIVPGSFMEPTVLTGAPFASDPRGVIVSDELLQKGVKIGDVIRLDRVLTELKVIGTAPHANIGHIPIAYAPLALWQEATYGPPGGPPPGDELPKVLFDYASVIALQMTDAAGMKAADENIGTVTLTREQSFNASPAYREEVLTVFMIQGFMIIVSALVVGAFFAVWTIQRTPEIGLVKALGASTAYLMRDAMGQALITLVSAIAVGGIAGYLMGRYIDSTGVAFKLEMDAITLTVGMLLAAGLIGAALSIRRIGGVDPIIALGAER
jgi:putative ABC transport system permease protein